MDTYATSLTSPIPAAAPAETVLRVGELVKLLRRHIWLIGVCAVGGAGIAYAVARMQPKTYTATSALVVEGQRFAIPELQGALRDDNAPDPMPWVRTEAQALNARPLVQEVVRKLDLVRDAEFNPELRPPTLLQRARDGANLLLGTILPHGPADAPAAGPDEAVLNAANKALSVFQDNHSLVISLTFTAQDPRLAALFINTLVTDYVGSRASRRSEVNQGANDVMTQRIQQVRGELDGIEQKMRDLRSKSELVALRAGSVGQQQVEELTSAAARATLDRSQLEATYSLATAAAKQGASDALVTVLNSPTISRLREQEAQASQRMAQLSTRYGADYPGMRSASAELGAARRQINEEASRIIASLGAQVSASREHEADVQKRLDAARLVGVQAGNVRAQLDELQQEATTRRALYQNLLERAQQTAAQPSADQTPDIRVLSPAVAPGQPSGPSTKLAGALGGAAGALLGCLFAFARLRSVDGFETADDVTAVTGLAVIATVPRRVLRGGLRQRGSERTQGSGADAEIMRGLIGRIRVVAQAGVSRSAMFVPLVDSEAALLAVAVARMAAYDGERVLLLEADLQTPRLAELLNQSGCDFTAVLTGGDVADDWRDAVVLDEQPGLELLVAGESGPGAHALLGSAQFQNMMIEAQAEYDLVVVHAPFAGSPDLARLAQRVDCSLLMLDRRSSRRDARAAAMQIYAAGHTSAAAVLLRRGA